MCFLSQKAFKIAKTVLASLLACSILLNHIKMMQIWLFAAHGKRDLLTLGLLFIPRKFMVSITANQWVQFP